MLTRAELLHNSFELLLGHLAMADDDAGLGYELLQPPGLEGDRLDSIVDEVDLSAAIELAQDRLANQALVILGHVGANRQPLLWGRLDGAHVAHPDQRHVEGARDWSGRQREHVDLAAKLLQALLVGDPEA